MPRGPKGQKRPADVIGAAIKVAKIATGEITEDVDENGKDKAAQSSGAAWRESAGKIAHARKSAPRSPRRRRRRAGNET